MIQKFSKKSTEVEAIQFNGNSNKQQIEKFVGKELKSELESETAYVAGVAPPIFSLLLGTAKGVVNVFRGDWVVKEPDGEVYCLKNDIFINTYALVLSNDDVIKFFDDNLATFRQWVKDAKTKSEQDIHFRFCDATSFLKLMWENRHNSKKPEVKKSANRGCCQECGEGYDNEEEWLYNTECALCKHPIPEHLIIKRP